MNAVAGPEKGSNVAQWRVRDVMTGDVVTVDDDAPVAEVAAVLVGHGISAVPVVDRFDVVVGVVSGTDLRNAVEVDASTVDGRGRWWRRRRSPGPRWPDATAKDLMTSPPVTVGRDASIAAAGRMMYRRHVGRLVVVDGRGRLAGIVSRADLLSVHRRLDAVVRDDVKQRVLRRTLMVDPAAVDVVVEEGVVTLTGRTVDRTTALAAVALTTTVPGVTDVVDRLVSDVDDRSTYATGAAGSEALR